MNRFGCLIFDERLELRVLARDGRGEARAAHWNSVDSVRLAV